VIKRRAFISLLGGTVSGVATYGMCATVASPVRRLGVLMTSF
jgi:hypothetical protein